LLRRTFAILDLAGGDLHDQLAELDRVARAFEALGLSFRRRFDAAFYAVEINVTASSPC